MVGVSTIYQMMRKRAIVIINSLQKAAINRELNKDYVGKLIKKGIPVGQTKENNKNKRLSGFPKLKADSFSSTIVALRDL